MNETHTQDLAAYEITISALTAERDALMAAGKRALEALDFTYELQFKILPLGISFSDVYNKQLGARRALARAGVSWIN
jgi:hypothetical protein